MDPKMRATAAPGVPRVRGGHAREESQSFCVQQGSAREGPLLARGLLLPWAASIGRSTHTTNPSGQAALSPENSA